MVIETSMLLIGAGGHARSIWAALQSCGISIIGYTEHHAADWLAAPWLGDDTTLHDLPPHKTCIGVGGVTPEGLVRRRALISRVTAAGHTIATVQDTSAVLAPDVEIGAGSQILAGAVIQAGAQIGHGCIINSRAIVEHESHIGDGTHIAPGAIVLGRCSIGANCMIGAGAVILPESTIPPLTLVPALTRWPR